jgi:rhodanese-related sulfurtransferase
LASISALGLNHFRPAGIPLVGDRSEAARFSDTRGKGLSISLEEARGLFEQDATLFLDARPLDHYLQGHIRGAVSLPLEAAEDRLMEAMEQLDTKKTLVTYCDGETCELSHDLALYLKESGFDNIRVLVNGWTLWKEAGLPVEAGTGS